MPGYMPGMRARKNRRQRRKAETAEVESFSNVKFTLNSGHEMPAVGLGTFRIRREEDIIRVVDQALDAGYRMFDTAAVYGNEIYLKKAFKTLLPKYGLERSDIFVTTKLSPSSHGENNIMKPAFEKSLENLGLEYVDLLLIHFPRSAKMRSEDPLNKDMRAQTWRGFEEIYEDGGANAIGVSNFTKKHLTELLANHCVVPAVNQVEWHPYYPQELLQFCKEKDIVLQANCALGGTSAATFSLLEDPVVNKIAQKLNKSCSQVLLVWALQQDVAVIPKSTDPSRIKENISLDFRLSNEDIKKLDEIGKDTMMKYGIPI